MRLRVGTQIDAVMLTAVGRWQLGLKYVLPEMCEQSRAGFDDVVTRDTPADVLGGLAARQRRGAAA